MLIGNRTVQRMERILVVVFCGLKCYSVVFPLIHLSLSLTVSGIEGHCLQNQKACCYWFSYDYLYLYDHSVFFFRKYNASLFILTKAQLIRLPCFRFRNRAANKNGIQIEYEWLFTATVATHYLLPIQSTFVIIIYTPSSLCILLRSLRYKRNFT